MKIIPLSGNKGKGYFALVDDEDFEKVSKYTWNMHKAGYAWCGSSKTVSFLMHRLIADSPRNMAIDHINGNRLDNRRQNLRLATKAENLRYRGKPKQNKSGYKGVGFDSRNNMWRSRLVLNYKEIWLGYFDTPEEAAKAYDDGAKKYFGEFAYLNFRENENSRKSTLKTNTNTDRI